MNGPKEQRIEHPFQSLVWSADYVVQVLMNQGKNKYIEHLYVPINF